jgi:hypothetical protein
MVLNPEYLHTQSVIFHEFYLKIYHCQRELFFKYQNSSDQAKRFRVINQTFNQRALSAFRPLQRKGGPRSP